MSETLPTPGAAPPGDTGTVLERMAALAREGAAPANVFAAVNDALARAVKADLAALLRLEAPGSLCVLASRGDPPLFAAVGARHPANEALQRLCLEGRASRFAFTVPFREMVGIPIVLGGRTWGAAVVATARPEGLADDTEVVMAARLELLTTALAMAQAGADAAQLRDDTSALQRLSTLAAAGAAPTEVFRAVATEGSALSSGQLTTLSRFEEDELAVVTVGTSDDQRLIGMRSPTESGSIVARIRRSHRPERIDDYAGRPGTAIATSLGLRASICAPVIVGGHLWGVLGTHSRDGPLPEGAEHRLAHFAEIAAASISNAQAQADERQLGREQAALLRVAELVARGVEEHVLFDTVTLEAAGLIDNENATLAQYEGGRTVTVVSTVRGPVPVGTTIKVPADDDGVLAENLRTLAPARRDHYDATAGNLFTREQFGVGSSVSVPIIVDGRLWGTLGTRTKGRRLPTETEGRLRKFTELAGAAIANSQARKRLNKLADDQAVLRGVAELVARSATLDEVFAAIAVGASAILGGLPAALLRHDDDGMVTVVACEQRPGAIGMRWTPDGGTYTEQVLRTGRPHRIVEDASSSPADVAFPSMTGAGVGVPVTVNGRIWGVMATSTQGSSAPVWAEDRLQDFAELAAVAIASAENKENLKASRARVVATADETRRRLQRDVHDGAQQRLVQTVITLKLSQDADAHGAPVTPLIDKALYHAERANAELRDLVHGILPEALSRGGLRAGIEAMLFDLPLVVDFESDVPRLSEETETTAYFIVAEALANVVKHAHADRAHVDASTGDRLLWIEVSDDGVGGADAARGSGLTGLADRVAAFEGTLAIDSPVGQGTVLRASIPIIEREGTSPPATRARRR